MAALGFALDMAGTLVAMGLATKPVEKPSLASTNIQIIVGHASGDKNNKDPRELGGGCPDVALWDDYGQRIGQYKPGKKCKIRTGDLSEIWNVKHKQTKPSMSQADPYYVMLSTMSDNAICISAISVVGQKIQGNFYGDLGFRCGMSWFLSDNAIGSDFTKPRCVWLDADHTNKINARAVSFHLNDLVANPDKQEQYKAQPDTICKSTPRFSFWGDMLPDGIPPFFNPRLQYTGENGADVDISKVIDDPNHPYNKGPPTRKRRSTKAKREENKGSNHDITQLIISENDDIREVCEHPNSYGWDIVSKKQSLFCCMEHKQLYPLCTPDFKDKCFDLKAKTLRGVADMHPEEEKHMRFGRSYNSTRYWK
ncbi:hypothetical protein HBI95_033940 [Parastagonospora nodorum]|nr:hypothetical protein HBI09_047870 [Parastagonospora nodorum]KAH4212175.1 hypothetical protein HBI95_033940 [Parastagonospora nodorum]KAH5020078.1 hypothetical protein HBI77_041980 [Parastagonospora nodorum]